MLDDLIARSLENKTSDPAAEAAVRTRPRLGNARDRLARLMTNNDAPLGLRREALRTFAQVGDGGHRLLAMVREKTLPDALKVEAATALRTHSDRRVRDEVEKLLPITSASGQPLPSIYELIRRDGKPDHGRAVFFRAGTNACGSCHRVQGQGQWVGPDLSTIGVKYGKEELLRSVLNPSAAISYNYRGLVVATTDGQIVTGLVVEETPDRLVLKTADGKRVTLRPAEIESRATSEISLMPEGLAQGLTEQDLVDLLAFLTTLKQPVSIIGRFDALTLPSAGANPPRIDPRAKFDPTATIEDPSGAKHTWRRVEADAEGRIELAPLTGGVASGPVVHLHAPVTSPDAQPARLIVDTNAEVQVWVGGVEVHLSRTGADAPRTAEITLPRGTTDLLVRVSKHVEGAAVVTTLVTNTPLEFSPSETAKVSAR
jgi:putative heme-binding domain-containing protein